MRFVYTFIFLCCLFFVIPVISKANATDKQCLEEIKILKSLDIFSNNDFKCSDGFLGGKLRSNRDNSLFTININDLKIKEDYAFSGLAFYYNELRIIAVKDGNVRVLKPHDDSLSLTGDDWLAVVGRFKVFLINIDSVIVKTLNQNIVFNATGSNIHNFKIIVIDKPYLSSVQPQLDNIRYSHLWSWLGGLAKFAEYILVAIQKNIVSNWGVTVILFGIFLKALLIPLDILVVRLHRQVSKCQSILSPQLNKIKSNYDGEEAHNMIMDLHKSLGISPFYTLKPMVGSLIKVPILVAVFNALGEMPQFGGQSFLWINNLAYPDSIYSLPVSIQMFGDKLSLLPIFMTVVTIVTAVVYEDKYAPEDEIKKQKIKLYIMALMFFVLFYPFPASMVLFWTVMNILQVSQQRLIKV